VIPLRRPLRIATFVLALGYAPALMADEAPTTQLTLPNGRAVTLERAVTPRQRSLGLMFRPALARDHGMLFIFPEPDRHTIWMKNMMLSIDILWLDAARRIVHLEANVPPCQYDPCLVYQPPTPARYVIELAAGVAAQAGLRVGITLSLSPETDAPH
jgi:hypothetical protein